MSNLLDKSSIVLTPTAYNNSKVLCVKPSDGSGDFDFSRNSAATRVNAQGLVEDVQILSGNKIINGDFSNGATDWVIENTWTIGDGVANGNGANGSGEELVQSGVLISGRTYSVTYEVKNYVSGNVRMQSPIGSIRSANGVYTEILTALQTLIKFRGTNFNGSISNISAIEITDDTNLPRINYDGFSFDGSGNIIPDSGCGSWLFEPQSTNLIPYSEDFSQWTPGGSTTIESGYLAPDGTNSAYKVSGAGSALTLPASLLTTTTRSIFARTVSGTGQANLCSFNSNTNNLFTITEQWQRFDVNSAIATGVTSFYAVDFRGATNLSEIILWGANATNDQDYVTSYVPSNGTSVTRNQDVCTNGGSAASINSTSGVLYAEIAALANDGTFRQIAISDGSTSNVVRFYYSVTDNRIVGNIKSSGSTVFNFNNVLTNATDFLKIAISYKVNDFKMYVNGVKVHTDTSGNSPTGLNEVAFDNGAGNDKFFGKTKALAVWKEALTETELQELTTI